MVDISYIEHFTDNLGKVRQHTTPKRKRFGKRTKYLSILVVLLVAFSVSTYGAIFLFFVEQESLIDVDHLFEWDDTVVEDYVAPVDNLGAMVGGDTAEVIHWLNYSALADSGITVTFQLTDGNITTDGLYMNLSYWDTDHWVELWDNTAIPTSDDYSFDVGENLKLRCYYELDTKVTYTDASGMGVTFNVI